MAAEESRSEGPAKWEGKHKVELKRATAQEVWPFLEDFCNIHKWFPNLDTCYQVEGVLGQPGLIRYCASTTPPSSDGAADNGIQQTTWAKEKLLMIDPTERCLSYEVVESNMGIKSYVATVQVLPINDGDCQQYGSRVEFSFRADPVEGWRFEDMDGHLKYCVQFMANKIEEEVLQSR